MNVAQKRSPGIGPPFKVGTRHDPSKRFYIQSNSRKYADTVAFHSKDKDEI